MLRRTFTLASTVSLVAGVVRRFFMFISILLLVLAAGVLVLWVRSYFRFDSVQYIHGRYGVSIHSFRGRMCLLRAESPQVSRPHSGWGLTSEPVVHYIHPLWYDRDGPAFASDKFGLPWGELRWWVTPHWSVSAGLVLLSILIGVDLLQRRKLRISRRKNGECSGCGYNLTGNTSGICPECGAAVVRSTPDAPRSA